MLRLGAALAVFLVLLGGAAWWLMKDSGDAAKVAAEAAQAKADQASAPAAEGEDGFFYNAIGTLPDDETAAATPKSASGPAKSSYTLEVLMTEDRQQAEDLIETLRDKGIDAYYTPLSRAGHVLYRVRRGIYTSRRDADNAALAFRQAAARDAKVVKLQ